MSVRASTSVKTEKSVWSFGMLFIMHRSVLRAKVSYRILHRFLFYREIQNYESFTFVVSYKNLEFSLIFGMFLNYTSVLQIKTTVAFIKFSQGISNTWKHLLLFSRILNSCCNLIISNAVNFQILLHTGKLVCKSALKFTITETYHEPIKNTFPRVTHNVSEIFSVILYTENALVQLNDIC